MVIQYDGKSLELDKCTNSDALYSMGWEAYLRGEAQNPFDSDDKRWNEWDSGWWDCREEYGKSGFGRDPKYFETCPICDCELSKGNCPNNCKWL